MAEIQRVNTYDDGRFSKKVLCQHGAFLVEGEPYEVEIVGRDSAQVRGARKELYTLLIEEFRFYAGHICRFFDRQGEKILEFPPEKLFPVKLADLQPSQFYVDEDKLAAVRTFIRTPEDLVIPVLPYEGRYISEDGHTRLAAAVRLGFDKVFAFTSQTDGWIFGFVKEAQKRGVRSPYDLPVIPHEEYEVKWNQFCDDYFAENQTGE